jgi:hypothetical protein
VGHAHIKHDPLALRFGFAPDVADFRTLLNALFTIEQLVCRVTAV